MAWNEPGGGKNNNNNPWGSGGKKPPDLEQTISEFFNKIKRIFGMSGNSNSSGNDNSSAFPIILVLLLIAVYAAWTSAYRIGPSERGVVLTFGKYSKTMNPGLNFTWPRPISEVYKVDVNQLYSVSESGEMLTEDKNLVFLEFDIQYRIRESKIYDYLFLLENPESTVKHAAESSVRQVVGTNTMSHLLNENREVAINQIVEELQSMLDQYTSGIQVTNFNFKEVHPPSQVKDAFDDVVKAREDAKTYINEANEYARQQIPLAEGTSLKIIQDAEAYKEATIAKSNGEAEKFDLVREQYELAPEVTKKRLYLDTMEQVLGNTSKVIIDTESNNNVMYLPLDQMLKNKNNSSGQKVYLTPSQITPSNQQQSKTSNSGGIVRNPSSRIGRTGR